MAINDFKAFASASGANVTAQEDYVNLPALLSGFQSGKASSSQINKALRQASFIAASLAQFVSDQSETDVLDDGDISGFVEKLTSGFAAQYLSRNNPFGDIALDGPDALAAALANLGLGEAATKSVGSGPFELPDMSLFEYSRSVNGYMGHPSGMKLQWMSTSADATSGTVALPVAFPNAVLTAIVFDAVGSGGPGSINLSWVQGTTTKSAIGWASNANPGAFGIWAIGY